MKKLSSAIICIVLCLGLLAGCGSAAPSGSGNEEAALREPLIGTWNQITDDGSPSLPEMGIPSAYIFNADGTGLDTFWNMSFVYTTDGEKLHIAYDDNLGEDWDYTYTIDKNVLSLTRVDDDAITMLYE